MVMIVTEEIDLVRVVWCLKVNKGLVSVDVGCAEGKLRSMSLWMANSAGREMD